MLSRIECAVGKPVVLKGYAIDVGHAIASIQFSLDRGEHWTEYPTEGTNDYQRVNWTFEYTPTVPGLQVLWVRSVNDRGKPSPEFDSVELFAESR